MSANSLLAVGWCPGALRPMMSGDGLLVRVKPRGGELTLQQAATLADLAVRFGNGDLELTGRGNLHLRGIGEAGLPALTDALSRLALLDPTPEAEAVRNIVSNPFAGFDPDAVFDGRSAVVDLTDRLVGDPALWSLPAKFSWVVDETAGRRLGNVSADVRFEAMAEARPGRFAIRVAGAEPDMSARCGVGDVADVAAALASAFLELCGEHGLTPHRMRDLARHCGAGTIMSRAGLVVRRGTAASIDVVHTPPIGPGQCGASHWIGLAPPFGRFRARDLDALVAVAAQSGAAMLRLTPWRTLLVPGLAEAEAGKIAATLTQVRSSPWIVDPADPRLAAVACSGAPACHRATTAVRDDAARLSAILALRRGPVPILHVSGCRKGCAHGQAAPVTLVGRDGFYDLVRDGKAADRPDLTGLTVDALAALLERECVS